MKRAYGWRSIPGTSRWAGEVQEEAMGRLQVEEWERLMAVNLRGVSCVAERLCRCYRQRITHPGVSQAHVPKLDDEELL
jgi:hypothetical protein